MPPHTSIEVIVRPKLGKNGLGLSPVASGVRAYICASVCEGWRLTDFWLACRKSHQQKTSPKSQPSAVKLFEKKKVRTHWDEKEQWYFSVIDFSEILTDSINPRSYWFKMKKRVKTEEGYKLPTVYRQLKMNASNGKMRETDVAHKPSLLCIIQSISSPKAETDEAKGLVDNAKAGKKSGKIAKEARLQLKAKQAARSVVQKTFCRRHSNQKP